jgi:uncharacterized membrane protein YheB (UPF0754 family)
MPAIQFIMILVIAAAGCWALVSLLIGFLFYPVKPLHIAGLRIQGILPAMHADMGNDIASAVLQRFFSAEKLQSTTIPAGLMRELRPQIASHVDVFLKEKLQETFPLLANFMGEKTLSKFKEAFLTEVELLLPVLLKDNLAPAVEKMQVRQKIAAGIQQASIPALKKMLLLKAGKKIRLLKLSAALFGLIIGLLQALAITGFFNYTH